MKTWLKGGLIALGILIIYAVFITLVNWIFGGITPLSIYSEKIILFVLYLIPTYQGLSEETGFIIGLFKTYILTPIFWFIIGATIGFIISKIKGKKKK